MSSNSRPAGLLTPRLLAHLALGSVALIYGLNYFIAKTVFEVLDPAGAVAIRTLGSALLFWLAAAWLRKPMWPAKEDRWRLVLCALLGVILNQNLFFAGLSRTLEVNASVLMTTSPLFLFLATYLMRSERMNGWKMLGLTLAFGSAFLLTATGKAIEWGGTQWWGDLLVLANAATYAVYLVMVRPLMGRYHVMQVMMWVFGISVLANLPFGLADILAADWQAAGWQHHAALAYVVLAVTVLAYGLNAFALQTLPSSQVGIYIYLQPVIVAVLAAFLPNKIITWWQISCMAFVIAGVALVSYRKKT